MFKNIKLKKALIGAGLGVLGVGTIVGTTWGISEIVSNRQNVDDIEDLTPGTPIIDGVEAGKNDGVHEMPKQITFTRYAKQATSNNTLTVTCTVLPDDTVNKKLTWTLQWADGGNHGAVADYVKMTVNGDTSQCTIQSLKEWTYKIKLVVKTTDGSNLSKECTLDYLGRELKYSGYLDLDHIYADTVISSIAEKVSNHFRACTVTGGTLQGKVVIDQVGFSLTDDEGIPDDVPYFIEAYNNPLVSPTTTFGQFIEANYASINARYKSARDAFYWINQEGHGNAFVKYHFDYSGTNYKSISSYEYAGCNYMVDFESKLTATSLSLNDTSFIF